MSSKETGPKGRHPWCDIMVVLGPSEGMLLSLHPVQPFGWRWLLGSPHCLLGEERKGTRSWKTMETYRSPKPLGSTLYPPLRREMVRGRGMPRQWPAGLQSLYISHIDLPKASLLFNLEINHITAVVLELNVFPLSWLTSIFQYSFTQKTEPFHHKLGKGCNVSYYWNKSIFCHFSVWSY